jgi:hypothetical protein
MSKVPVITSSKWLARFFIDSALLVFFALLTVNRFSPEFLNADVILQSVMSLQNVTVFCWGQNRFANILPLVASPISNPALNLYACLLMVTTVFYGLIWFWADRLSRISFPYSEHSLARREIFLVLTSIFFFIARPNTVFEITTVHVEYTLSYLLLGVVFFYYFSKKKSLLMRFAATGACLAVAIGVNYSIVIPALFLVGARALFKRKLDIDSLVFSAFVVVLFISWGLIARFYPNPGISYASFEFEQLNHSVQIVAKNLIDAVYLGNLVLVLLAACLLKIFTFSLPQENASSDYTRTGLFTLMLLVFSGVWILLFSINSWVSANLFNFRYFVPVIFVGMMLLSLEVRSLTVFLSRWQGYAVSVLLAAWLIVHLAQPFVPLRDYTVFKRINAVLPGDVVGYAGDYWSVWPAVMKNLLEGKEGFGFTSRAEGNRDNLTRYFSEVGRRHGSLTIGCLNAPIDQCHSQVKNFLGDVGPGDAEFVGDGIWLLHIDYERAVLMNGPLGEADFALDLLAKNVPTQWQKNELRQCTLRVKNNGNVTLSSAGSDFNILGKYAIRLSYRWVEVDSSVPPLSGFDTRTALPVAVKPNAEITMKMGIKAPSKLGKYWLEIEAVQESVAWFKDKGSPGIRIEVAVK